MGEEIKIIKNLPLERWEEFKNLKIEAIKDSPSAFSHELSEAESQPDESWRSVLNKNIERKSIVIFLESEEKLIGLIGGRVYSKEMFKHNASIDTLYINKKYRGRGLAELLEKTIIEMISQNPQVINIICEVSSSQVASLALQKKLGFQVSGVLKDFGYFEGKYLDSVHFIKRIK